MSFSINQQVRIKEKFRGHITELFVPTVRVGTRVPDAPRPPVQYVALEVVPHAGDAERRGTCVPTRSVGSGGSGDTLLNY